MTPVINNEATKKQIRDFLDRAYKKARNPHPRELLKRERERRKQTIIKSFGFN